VDVKIYLNISTLANTCPKPGYLPRETFQLQNEKLNLLIGDRGCHIRNLF